MESKKLNVLFITVISTLASVIAVLYLELNRRDLRYEKMIELKDQKIQDERDRANKQIQIIRDDSFKRIERADSIVEKTRDDFFKLKKKMK